MKRPSFSLLLGCLLVGTAGVLVATRNGGPHEAAGKPPPTRNRDRHPRPASGVSSARLLASTRQHTSASREAWAGSLDDAELRRLTRALIAAYQEKTNSRNDVASWLVPLAKEWGRRDVDGLFVEMKALEQDDIGNNPDACLAFSNVRAAALIGLSEIDPRKAFQLLIQPKENDFIQISTASSEVAESIFRNWAKQDPAQAWHELSGTSLTGWSSADGIRGLIAGCSDPELHKEILQWIADRKRQAKDIDPLGNDFAIKRNNIDAILNNPNSFDSNRLIASAALGIAEHDLDKAWKWLNSQPPAQFGDVTMNGELFSSSGPFLHEWAERHPQQVLAFMYRHSDQFTPGQRIGAAGALFSREPEAALDVLAGIPDLAKCESAITDLMNITINFPVFPNCLLVESVPAPLPALESIRRTMENLDRLGMPESETAALRLKLEKLTNAQDNAAPP